MNRNLRRFVLKVIFNAWFLVSYTYRLGRVKTILFYPHLPDRGTVIYKIAKILGCKITNDPNRKHDLAIHWEDITIRKSEPLLVKLNRVKPVINFDCWDITKSNVHQKFKRVFQYDLFIDPLVHDGKCLMKTEINGQHDGIAIACPISEQEAGYVYEKIIQCKDGEDRVVAYRTPVIKNMIPLVYVTYRPADKPFGKVIVDSYVANPTEVYSGEEIDLIISFCRQIGLDYGELDIVRDDLEGRIYILDCNNTPGGPTKLTAQEMFFALRSLSQGFKQAFFRDELIPAIT